MIEHGPETCREFYVEPDGKRWLLARDAKTGRPYVLHHLGDDRLKVELDLGSFLVLFEGREREALFRLIASLLPGGDEVGLADTNVARPARFGSRRMPGR